MHRFWLLLNSLMFKFSINISSKFMLDGYFNIVLSVSVFSAYRKTYPIIILFTFRFIETNPDVIVGIELFNRKRMQKVGSVRWFFTIFEPLNVQ